MATIVTRAGKGSALTWQEGDDNFTNLNSDKIEAVSDDATPSLGGNLDVGTHSITTTEIDGDITIFANGSGIVALNNDVTIGTGSADAYLTSNGARDLFITTDDGATEPYIQLQNGANGGIVIQPDGNGKIDLNGLLFPTADGTAGQVIVTDGAGNLSFDDAGTFDPASPGAIGGTTPSTATFTQVTVNGTGELRLADTDSSNYVGFKAPGTVSTNRIWTLPATDGTSGQLLSTNGSGVLSWVTDATGGGGSAGSNFALIFCATADLNVSSTASNGNVFSGSETLTEDYDPDNIVSVNGDRDIVLAAAGTYIYEVTSVSLVALAYGAGAANTQLTSPTAYFNIYNLTTSTQIASQDLTDIKHPGNGNNITYRSNLGAINIKVKIVTTTTNNVIRLRVTGQAASSGGSTMRFPGNRPITFTIVKVA